MKKKMFVIAFIIVGMIFTTLGIIIAIAKNSNKYHIANNMVAIDNIYFNNAEGLACNEDNPYREQLLLELESLCQKKTRTPTEFEHEPEITIIASDGTIYEMSAGATHYEYPEAMDSEYENKDESSYYIRVKKDNQPETIEYYEWDDAIPLRKVMFDAIYYAYQQIGNMQGIVTGIYEGYDKNNESFRCAIETFQYGYILAEVDTLDNAIVGDTVELILYNEDRENISADCRGTIRNITQNNITKTSSERITQQSFNYNIVTFDSLADPSQFDKQRIELIMEYDDLIFQTTFWEDGDVPQNVIKELKKQYNEDFFENNMLAFCGIEVTDVEVTAVAQSELFPFGNNIYVRKKTSETVPTGTHKLLFVEISKEKWNDTCYNLYLYE